MAHLEGRRNLFHSSSNLVLDTNVYPPRPLAPLTERHVMKAPSARICGALTNNGTKIELSTKSKKLVVPVENRILAVKESKKHCNVTTAVGALTCTAPEASKVDSLVSGSKSAKLKSEPEDADRFKTELCRSWEELGRCKYGLRCKFAHGCQELRPLDRHPRYKTIPCRQFHTRGFCSYGSRCHFIHGETDRLLLAFLVTAVQLERAKQGNSKLSAKNLDCKKSSNRGSKNKAASSKSANLKTNSISSLPSVKTDAKSSPLYSNSQFASWMDGPIHDNCCDTQIHQLCADKWDLDAGMGPIHPLDDFHCDGPSMDGVEMLLNEIKKRANFDDKIEPLNANLPLKAECRGFFWPNQPRSRTSSGESFGEDLDLSTLYSGSFTNDEQQKNELHLLQQHHHQLMLSQQHILEGRLVETLQMIQNLQLESETLNTALLLSKLNASVCGKMTGNLSTSDHVGPSLMSSGPPHFLGWDRTHSLESSSVSSGSPPNFHWSDLQLDINFEANRSLVT